MKRSSINHYSLKKIAEIQGEAPIRIALCQRAGGNPITSQGYLTRNGIKYPYTKMVCVGGTCECGLPDCPKQPRNGQHLEPHEQVFRSKGGKLSLENSLMVLRPCHQKLQGNYPRWSKAC